MTSRSTISFRVVGLGRTGRSLIKALDGTNWEYDGGYGRLDDPTDAAVNVDAVFVAVPDDAITDVARAVTPTSAVLIHLSGAKTLDVLAPHEHRASVHPLVSLPDPETGSARLRGGAVFAVAGHHLASEVVEALGGRAIEVDERHRSLYHAGAVVAANHLVVLCAQVERIAERLGVPVELYWALMTSTLANVEKGGALRALTGPAARGDTDTIEAHLRALAELGSGEAALYRVMAAGASELGRIAGNEPAGAGALEVVKTVAELRRILDRHRIAGRSVGFVPTMGYLHDGHASLMRAAAAGNDIVVASIFVNPLQFAPDEDLESYPRDLDHDRSVAAANGVDVLFVPTAAEMYPNGTVLTQVSVSELSERWDGASRPTHFAGVATVVAKLFSIVGSCRAYFGEKDFQQLAIIRRMAEDLSMPVAVIGCPIVREDDGLAMSSRNVYLAPEDRAAAVVLRRALAAGERAIDSGETDPAAVADAMRSVVDAEPRARLDYVAVVDPATLETPPVIRSETRLLIAAYLGDTRLIDNCPVRSADESS